MLYTGPWGSVHFFPLCFLYWIISINLSLSSLTLLCHSFLLLSPHRRSYKCPSISPHEGQRVKQDMNLNSNRESCLQVFWYLALVALCQQKNIHAKMTVGKNGSSTFCRLIKHTHTYIHTHTQLMGCHISDPHSELAVCSRWLHGLTPDTNCPCACFHIPLSPSR